jgi:hypothetical protein
MRVSSSNVKAKEMAEKRSAESFPLLLDNSRLHNKGLSQALQEAEFGLESKKFAQPYDQIRGVANTLGGASLQNPQFRALVSKLTGKPDVGPQNMDMMPSNDGMTSLSDILSRTKQNEAAGQFDTQALDIYGLNRPGGREYEVAKGTTSGEVEGSDWREKNRVASAAAIALQQVANKGHLDAASVGRKEDNEFRRQGLFGGVAGNSTQVAPMVQTALSGVDTILGTPNVDKPKVHAALSNLSTTGGLVDIMRKSAEAQLQALGADEGTILRTLAPYDAMKNALSAGYQRIFAVHGKMYDYSKPQSSAGDSMSTFGNEGVGP